MTTNDSATPQSPYAPFTWTAAPKKPKEPHVYSRGEKLLVPAALVIAILFDRLVVMSLRYHGNHFRFFSGIFWLLYLIGFYALYWRRLRGNRTLWFVGGFSAALCIWNLLFDYDSNYGMLTFYVIPAVLMAHAVYFACGCTLRDAGKAALAWLHGWFVRPFSSIAMLFGAAGSMAPGTKKSAVKQGLVGLAVCLPLLIVIIPLLCEADSVFRYFVGELAYRFNLATFIFHVLVVAVATMLFYSFLWSLGYAAPTVKAVNPGLQIGRIVTCTVLGVVLLLYVLFCAVQFTYLFAGAGLPGTMTYSDYAREGFAQIIKVCFINLLLFGIFLQYGRPHRLVSGLLAGLLALTGVMLASGFVRLRLYIDAYGLTWKRLLSLWFIFYLAAVLALCAVRMVKKGLPVITVCALVLLGWYTALGYANPDALIMRYNLSQSESPAAWAEENEDYVRWLSDDAVLAMLDSGLDAAHADAIIRSNRSSGYSLSSCRLRQRGALK